MSLRDLIEQLRNDAERIKRETPRYRRAPNHHGLKGDSVRHVAIEYELHERLTHAPLLYEERGAGTY